MAWIQRAVATLSLVTLVVSVAAISPNDDGRGIDAGNTQGSAMGVTGNSWHYGAINYADDHDWYALPASSGPVCLTAKVKSWTAVDALLAPQQTLTSPITAALAPNAEIPMGLAATSANAAYLGIKYRPDTNLDYSWYAFQLKAQTPSQLGPQDAGTGIDAGATPSTGITPSAPCWNGLLSAPAGDWSDVYAFPAALGQTITFSVAQASMDAPVLITLVSPSGVQRATAVSGGISGVAVDEPGTWTLTASMAQPAAQAPYLVGLTVAQTASPDPNPCRPDC